MVSFHGEDEREGYYPEKIIARTTEEDELVLLGESPTRWIVGEPMEVEQ